MRTQAMWIVAVTFCSPVIGLADDSLVAGRRLKAKVGTTGSQAALVADGPTSPISDDPTVLGATIEIRSVSGESGVLRLPACGWSRVGDAFKFKNSLALNAPTLVKTAFLHTGSVLKVKADSTGITLDEPAQRGIGVALVIGAQHLCTNFGGLIRTDRPGYFSAKHAPPPAACQPIVTPPPPVPVCGNGVFEPNGCEECDDGNATGGDGCSPTCRYEWPAECTRITPAIYWKLHGNGVPFQTMLARAQRDGWDTSFTSTVRCVVEGQPVYSAVLRRPDGSRPIVMSSRADLEAPLSTTITEWMPPASFTWIGPGYGGIRTDLTDPSAPGFEVVAPDGSVLPPASPSSAPSVAAATTAPAACQAASCTEQDGAYYGCLNEAYSDQACVGCRGARAGCVGYCVDKAAAWGPLGGPVFLGCLAGCQKGFEKCLQLCHHCKDADFLPCSTDVCKVGRCRYPYTGEHALTYYCEQTTPETQCCDGCSVCLGAAGCHTTCQACERCEGDQCVDGCAGCSLCRNGVCEATSGSIASCQIVGARVRKSFGACSIQFLHCGTGELPPNCAGFWDYVVDYYNCKGALGAANCLRAIGGSGVGAQNGTCNLSCGEGICSDEYLESAAMADAFDSPSKPIPPDPKAVGVPQWMIPADKRMCCPALANVIP